MPRTPVVDRGLPYLIMDADEHSTPPDDAYERYIDPGRRDMAIRTVKGPDGTTQTLYNGRPPRLEAKNWQVVASEEMLAEIGVKGKGDNDDAGGRPVPLVDEPEHEALVLDLPWTPLRDRALKLLHIRQ